MPTRPNGGFIGTENVTDYASASGIYTLNEARELTAAGEFPPARYVPSRSLRFDGTSYLYRTLATSGNRRTWTWSGWVKGMGSSDALFGAAGSGGGQGALYFTSNSLTLREYAVETGSETFSVITNAKYRDHSAWYHIVAVFDTTQSTPSDRIKLYVNGVLQTSFSTANYPSPNWDAYNINNSSKLALIGTQSYSGSGSMNGYMTEVNFIDGSALTPFSFGYTDPKTGAWMPKRYTGSYGNQGYYLSFANNSSTTTLGYDDGTGAVGAGAGSNDWTTSGFSVANDANGDSFVDVPGIGSTATNDIGGVVRGNYCTLNPIGRAYGSNSNYGTWSNGSLQFASSANPSNSWGTMTVPSDPNIGYYWEAVCTSMDAVRTYIGLMDPHAGTPATSDGGSYQWPYKVLLANDGAYRNFNSGTAGASEGTYTSFTTNDVIMIAYKNGSVWFGKNGTWMNSGNPATNVGALDTTIDTTKNWLPYVGYNSTWVVNFGQRQFAYTPPTGFKSLCTANLPEPQIIRSKDHFDVKLYAGNGTTQTIGNTAKESENYQISRSLRFNSADTPYLSRAVPALGNRKKITWSGWYKSCSLSNGSTYFVLFRAADGVANFNMYLTESNTIEVEQGGSNLLVTTGIYQNIQDWTHYVLSIDTSNPNQSERAKIYVNGVRLKDVTLDVSLNLDLAVNSTSSTHYIGNTSSTSTLNGYLTEVNFVDGEALDASYFGQFDVDGSWKPKEYTGTIYGPDTSYITYLDNDSDYLSIANSSSQFSYGTGDFTLEFWYRPLSFSNTEYMTIGRYNTSTGSYGGLQIVSGTVAYWYTANGSSYTLNPSSSETLFVLNNWHHVAISRASGTLRYFVDGKLISSHSDSTNYTGTSEFRINNALASSPGYRLSNYSNVRVLKGTGLYTTGFSVPTSDLTAITNTVLLTCQGSTFIDASTVGATVTANGTAAMIPYNNSYGTNGFYLPFSDNSSEDRVVWDSKNDVTRYDTAGSYTYAVPSFSESLIVEVWGGGGGGGEALPSVSATAGGQSSFNSTVIANGGNPGAGASSGVGSNGTGGTASGGDLNVTGNTGNSTSGSSSSTPSPYSGNIGIYGVVGPGGYTGITGQPVGSGGGGAYWTGGSVPTGGAGGSGGYSRKVYYPGQISGNIAVVVGAGGNAGVGGALNGGTGRAGMVRITVDGSATNDLYQRNISVSAGAGNDSLVDVPTDWSQDDSDAGGEVRGNYCTFQTKKGSTYYPTISNGNLTCTAENNTQNPAFGTFKVSSGKWYYEVYIDNKYYSPNIGWTEDGNMGTGDNWRSFNNHIVHNSYSGTGYVTVTTSNGTSGTQHSQGSSSDWAFATGNTVMVALDADAKKIWFGRNGTWYTYGGGVGNPGTGAYPTASYPFDLPLVPAFDGTNVSGNKDTMTYNFGQRPFTYTPPTGFKSLNTRNLNEQYPFVNGPDLVWIKVRNDAQNHRLFDTVRGSNKRLMSSSTAAEATTTNELNAFNSNGFTLGNNTDLNGTNYNYVAWCWNAGSRTVGNTDGTITSTVRANPAAGFSIVSWTGTGAAGTVGHGLGVVPKMIIHMNTAGASWPVYHSSVGGTAALFLNLTGNSISSSTYFNNTSPSNTTFSVADATSTNGTGNRLVAYCFAPVSGYSAFGSYIGNSLADGSFVYLGFRPKYVLIKPLADNWWSIFDSARQTYNSGSVFNYLRVESTSGDNNGGATVYAGIDFLSNGFKLRANGLTQNTSGTTYIYAAFAEAPFKYANAR